MKDHELHHEVEQFLYYEAMLLDEGEFEQWLALFTDDARYEVPIRQITGTDDGAPALALVSDGLEQLRLRVARLGTGLAHAEQPRSRTRRNVGNVLVLGREGDTVEVRSNLLLFQSRLERSEAIFSGVRVDTLRRGGEHAFRIAARRVTLDQALLPRTLSLFL